MIDQNNEIRAHGLIDVYYYLSKDGQKRVILSGDKGIQKRKISIEVKESLLDLCDVDENGNLSILIDKDKHMFDEIQIEEDILNFLKEATSKEDNVKIDNKGNIEGRDHGEAIISFKNPDGLIKDEYNANVISKEGNVHMNSDNMKIVQELSDGQLLIIINENADDHEIEFLGLVQDELHRRGILFDNDAFAKYYTKRISTKKMLPSSANINRSGTAIVAFVLGIVGLIAWLLPILGFPITITGLLLGIRGLKSNNRRLSTAGIVLSIIFLLATIINSAIGAYQGYRGELFSVSKDSNYNVKENATAEVKKEDTGEPTAEVKKEDTEEPTSDAAYEKADNTLFNKVEKDKADANYYVLPYSDVNYLSEADLSYLTKKELRIARNEIYARHGRIFDSEDLKTYFNNKLWYTSTIPANQFNESILNVIEKYNINFISEYEKADAQQPKSSMPYTDRSTLNNRLALIGHWVSNGSVIVRYGNAYTKNIKEKTINVGTVDYYFADNNTLTAIHNGIRKSFTYSIYNERNNALIIESDLDNNDLILYEFSEDKLSMNESLSDVDFDTGDGIINFTSFKYVDNKQSPED